jgi:hypothetical protein
MKAFGLKPKENSYRCFGEITSDNYAIEIISKDEKISQLRSSFLLI